MIETENSVKEYPKQPEKPKVTMRQLKPFKMKLKAGRNRVVIDLFQVFGFQPDVIVIDRIPGGSCHLQVGAIIPQDKAVPEVPKKE